MNRRKRSPFRKQSIEVVPVIDTGFRKLYFGKFGYITTVLNPIDYQDLEKKRAMLTQCMMKAANQMAEARNMPVDEAWAELASNPDNSGGFISYLSESEQAQLMGLQQELAKEKELEIKIATLFIQHRMAYELEVDKVSVKDDLLKLSAEPWFEVNPGDRFMANGRIVEAVEAYEDGSFELSVDSAKGISKGVMFLLKPGTSEYELGVSGWTEDDTKSELSIGVSGDETDTHVKALYRFYLEESGQADVLESGVEDLGESDSANDGGDLSNTSTPHQSTGVKRTGESKNLASEMTDSATKDLATAP